MEEAWQLEQLKRFCKSLKSELKRHSGKKIDKNTPLYEKLYIYNKVKALLSEPTADPAKLKKYYVKYVSGSTSDGDALSADKNNESAKEKTELDKGKIAQAENIFNGEGKAEEDANEDADDDADADADADAEVTEIAPTPQLEGRVLSLFSIATPQSLFKHPKISPAKSLLKDTSLVELKPTVLISESPIKSTVRELCISPSPLFKGRNLAGLKRELEGLKKNLNILISAADQDASAENCFEYDHPIDNETDGFKTLSSLMGLNDNVDSETAVQKDTDTAAVEGDDPATNEEVKVQALSDTSGGVANSGRVYKAKTVKRTTRRVRMKTEKHIEVNNQFEDVNIHGLATEEAAESDSSLHDDDVQEHTEDASEDEYERMDLQKLKEQPKSKSKHPLSNNFVKMKIHYKNKGRFKKRRT
ncbi:hypothetical protein DAMA08_014670 [Martiniozyma asiatica (nom. inval.)]|nr:hypothetical protein DAMA08_014670 [Martiniozyma asiatica]